MTPTETNIVIKWILENIDSNLVPTDEGNSEGLIYNCLMAAMQKEERFEYKPSQYKLIIELRKQMDLPENVGLNEQHEFAKEGLFLSEKEKNEIVVRYTPGGKDV